MKSIAAGPLSKPGGLIQLPFWQLLLGRLESNSSTLAALTFLDAILNVIRCYLDVIKRYYNAHTLKYRRKISFGPRKAEFDTVS